MIFRYDPKLPSGCLQVATIKQHGVGDLWMVGLSVLEFPIIAQPCSD